MENMELDKRIVLITVSLSSFLTPFAGSSFNIALPSIGREYNLNALTMSWASLSYLLASAMLLIPFGKLADLYGRKRVYLYGITLFTIASGLLPLYPSAYTLIGFRALMGVGSAMIFGTGVAILTSSVSAEERGSMLGVNVAVVYVGLSIGPFLGGYLTENLGWESIFYFNVLIGLTSILLTLTKLRAEWKEEDVKKFDYIGSVLYSLTLLFLIYGISNIRPKTAAKA